MSGGSAISETPTLDEIVNKAREKQMMMTEDIEDSIFVARSVYKEMGKDGEIKKKVITKKRVYVKRYGKQREEYLSIIIDGRELDGKEMKKEAEKMKKNSKSREMKMPLTKEGEGMYEYQLSGDGTQNDVNVWIVDFNSKEEEDGYINGKGYISKDGFNIVRAEFTPAKLSSVIQDIDMSMNYSEIQGYWFPAEFKMDLTIKLSFLYYKRIIVEETYSEYKFNNGIEDSFFETD
jgi:hypothetical protein